MAKSDKEKEIAQNLKKIGLDKLAVKEAIREWLDQQWKETLQNFGLWSLRALALLFFTAMIILILWSQGYHK